MAIYAIGDVQGCYDALRRLLDIVGFDPPRDRLWLVGDLVNRGPQSLQTLRYLLRLGDNVVSVLGNHDLHLLVAASSYTKQYPGDTLSGILDAPDRDELLHWLRQQKLMHVGNGYAMVHAGLLPQWSVAKALSLARETEAVLRGGDYDDLLRPLYGNHPARWSDELKGDERHRVIVNAMTRMRLCTLEGEMEFRHKLAPINMPSGYLPWYDIPNRASRDTPILFGHWASLGVLLRADVIGLDSGCVWGRKLTAFRLEDRRTFQCGCAGLASVGD
ncbi:MAG: symmetrical bis(5'-nucleosyl)-tetraphosphatase [Betaproteobacteria bacterium]|nr:symmetrical bis(5'-nucleosyl)-tetraphosphatase [Betaproteobacteria bacterium]